MLESSKGFRCIQILHIYKLKGIKCIMRKVMFLSPSISLCLFHFSSRVSYFLDAQLPIHMLVAFFLEGTLCD